MRAVCGRCQATLDYDQVHTGFNNTGYAYCDRDGALVVWDTFDPSYVSVVGQKHPWRLDHRERTEVEMALRPCPCGGRFGMANPPRCPRCHEPLPDLLPDPTYFADFGRRFDPVADDLWATAR